MKNKLVAIIVASVFTLFSTYLFAGSFNVGVTGSMSSISATGSEAHGDENTSASVDHTGILLGSFYAEYEMDGFAIGIEHTPGSADVSEKVRERTETPLSITSSAATQSTEVTRKAQAEIENYYALYAEIPVMGSLFVRLGMAQIDVNTLENLGSNSGSYGNDTIDGINYGAGVKGTMAFNDNVQYKFWVEKTDFDTLKLTSSGNSVAAETGIISADLDLASIKFGLGYKF